MSLNNITKSDVQTLLNLGYYLRGKPWSYPTMHLRIGDTPEYCEIYIGNTQTMEFEYLKLLEETTTWEIYQVGTLPIQGAYELLQRGYNISRIGWLSKGQTNLVTTSLTCSRHLLVSDVVNNDWFVPLDATCQSLGRGDKITPQMVALYNEYMNRVYSINLVTKEEPTDGKYRVVDPMTNDTTDYTVSTKDYPGIMGVGIPAITVESILADNENHITGLETSVISCTVVNRLLKHMKRDNVSIDDLGKRLDVNVDGVVKLLSRPQNLSVHDLILIGNAINCTVYELFK